MKISGNIVDVVSGAIYTGTIEITDGTIVDIVKNNKSYVNYIIPGFVDSHIHIESSMLTPAEFSRLAIIHGTVATVSDPHEIANVLGIEGVRYMMENGNTTPFKFYFGAPSCVPATPFETSGAQIGVAETETLLKNTNIKYLSEMMNVPGVIHNDIEVITKIAIARKHNKPIDGHAPSLRGDALKRYISAGITTDHECFDKTEALEKISLGMKILIREGSAAKNFEALYTLVGEHPDACMFCSDDKHPDDLAGGHINELVKRAINKGIDVIKVLRCATLNPVLHYELDVGFLQINQPADFIIVDNLIDFNILKTFIRGTLVAEKGKTYIAHKRPVLLNRFQTAKKTPDDFRIGIKGDKIRVIEAIDGQLITGSLIEKSFIVNDNVLSDPDRDILKIAVISRYENKAPAIGFVKNFGLKGGAIASSVAHDSHNIIAVGVSDEAICDAVNLIIEHRGGISLVSDGQQEILPLPIAGIMSDGDGFAVAKKYAHLDRAAKKLGSKLHAPYMTLSFMALLVIPTLKISDKGLFNGETFSYTDLFVGQ
ncbi:MAG: adenine deaminase [Syntrophus sp. (in: bacteria)]|nr:adenine deaminase [Syntrophus sp. (in: bacteria)]